MCGKQGFVHRTTHVSIDGHAWAHASRSQAQGQPDGSAPTDTPLLTWGSLIGLELADWAGLAS